jgi:hypothetical protein
MARHWQAPQIALEFSARQLRPFVDLNWRRLTFEKLLFLELCGQRRRPIGTTWEQRQCISDSAATSGYVESDQSHFHPGSYVALRPFGL